MILESDITKFPLLQQKRIRAELAQMIKDGYPEMWLILLQDGQIVYDEIAHAKALAAAHRKQLPE